MCAASTAVGGAPIAGRNQRQGTKTDAEALHGERDAKALHGEQKEEEAEVVLGIRNPEEVKSRQNTRQSADHDVNDTHNSGSQNRWIDDSCKEAKPGCNTTPHEHDHGHECDVQCDDGNTAMRDHGHECDVNVNVCNIDKHMW